MDKEIKVTEEERFLNHIRSLVEYWEKQDCSSKKKLDGLAFSILTAIDGDCISLPQYLLSPLNSTGCSSVNLSGELHSKFFEMQQKHILFE